MRPECAGAQFTTPLPTLQEARIQHQAHVVASNAAPPKKQPAKAEVAAAAPAASAWVNTQRFVVPVEAQAAFMDAWEARAAHMETMSGFEGYVMKASDDDEFIVESRWASIAEWEAFNLSKTARRQHLPSVRALPLLRHQWLCSLRFSCPLSHAPRASLSRAACCTCCRVAITSARRYACLSLHTRLWAPRLSPSFVECRASGRKCQLPGRDFQRTLCRSWT